MSDKPVQKSYTEFRTPPLLRGTAIFGMIVSALLVFISFMAWSAEGAAFGLWLLPLWLGMGLYWLRQWWLWTRRIQLASDHLMIITPFVAPQRLDYTQIIALDLDRSLLHLNTTQSVLQLRGDANTCARVAEALEKVVPALRKAKEEAPALPIVVAAQTQPVLLSAFFGLLIGAAGIALLYSAIVGVELENRGAMAAFGVAMLALCGAALYWLLVTFVWHYRFDKEQIEVRQSLRSQLFPVELLREIALHQRNETTRGVTKTLHTLHMRFADRQHLTIQPGAQNYPFDYPETYERILLERLLAQLRLAYQSSLQPPTAKPAEKQDKQDEPMPGNQPISSPMAMTPQTQAVTRTELDVASLPQQDGRFADYAYQLYSAPADLTVTLINYGERQPAAETVEIRLSRGIAGEESFSTTNGNALFSESGQILLLHDSFLLIVVETRSMSAWHFPVGERIFLVGAHWQGEQLYFSRLPYGRPSSETETLGPLSLQEIIRECDLGVGRWSSRKPVAASLESAQLHRAEPNMGDPWRWQRLCCKE